MPVYEEPPATPAGIFLLTENALAKLKSDPRAGRFYVYELVFVVGATDVAIG